MRDTIRDFEKAELVKAVAAGKTWEEAKALLPDVDPEVLDRGFKAHVHREAGVELVEEPALELPEGVEGVTADELHAAVDKHLEAGGSVVLESAKDGEQPAPDEQGPAPEPTPAAAPKRRGRPPKQPKA